MQKIAISRDDGSVAIMSFLTEGRSPELPNGAAGFSDGSWAREANDKNISDEISKTFPTGVVSWRRITSNDIPVDRTFRNAWVDRGKIETDIEKAKVIKLGLLRDARAEAFPELDALWMRAVGQGDLALAAEIEAKREVLRNIPADPRIEAAVSVEELKAIELPR